MFTRNGISNLKEIKRGNQTKKSDDMNDVEGEKDHARDANLPPAKRNRQDYAAFKCDVARLQKNLNEFEQDLKEHTTQVRLQLPVPTSGPELPRAAADCSNRFATALSTPTPAPPKALNHLPLHRCIYARFRSRTMALWAHVQSCHASCLLHRCN